MTDQGLDGYMERLRSSGIKLTQQRMEIFKEVASRIDHPDAASVYERVRKRLPTISLDTVYRTLWMLKEAGLITTLGSSHDRMRFDANTSPHHHFVCTQCGKTADFYCAEYNNLRAPTGISALGTVIEAQVELRGVCLDCTNKVA
jgi:Fur family peroxide stress response transcriptional regulator